MQRNNFKFFSLDEANELLPVLELHMARLLKDYFELKNQLRFICDKTGGNVEILLGRIKSDPSVEEQVKKINQTQSYFNELGVIFKSLELGIIDFPSILSGEVIFLCWQFGENLITHYHGINENFNNRRPIVPPSTRYNTWQAAIFH
ncbi:DUF2203 domain-containing protein [Candidatus Riflebacteria bacterium]